MDNSFIMLMGTTSDRDFRVSRHRYVPTIVPDFARGRCTLQTGINTKTQTAPPSTPAPDLTCGHWMWPVAWLCGQVFSAPKRHDYHHGSIVKSKYAGKGLGVGVGVGGGESVTAVVTVGAGLAFLAECRMRDRKVAGSSPGSSGRRIFFSRVNFLC